MARMKSTAIIPEDIIVEIVMRLPIKPVGRCRCVCKRWRSLFSGLKFAKSHIQTAFERQTLCQRLFLLTHEYESLDLELGELKELKKSSLRVEQLNAPFKKPGHALCFLGSCNGLVACFSGDLILKNGCFTPKSRLFQKESLFIWNPSTGFYKEIPGEGFYLPWGVSTRGFGHVSGTDDYKVVLRGKRPREVSLFSLRAGTWKSIKSPVIGTMQRKGLFLREALHWLAYERDNTAPFKYSGLPIVLFAFDLAKEEFRKMQVPSSRILDLTYESRLGVSCEGCLYIMHYSRLFEPKCIYYVVDFWVMREYGNSDSWTRSFSLRFSDEPNKPIYMLEPILLKETSAFVMNRPKKFDQDKEEMPDHHMYMIHDQNKQENASMYILHSNPPDMIVYEESLSDYHKA
ncbi:putative F-box domain-containing protein [Rosa chinensis]|uniref:Putative F-box domain-containing protein n=1 Tax=Rosa chinensis TaxID=74649 RepID=A0A2P6RSV4_ROSCH|nr:F-box protein CPR1 [Rosa chinensis]PRQ49502.1 putative F-box domain-containing protein [Rosa chinensis]